VNLEACYPNPEDPSTELSFEELRATRRGWMDKLWTREEGKSHEVCGQNATRGREETDASVVDESSQADRVPKSQETILESNHIVVPHPEAIISEQQESIVPSKKQAFSGAQPLENTLHDENRRLEDEKYGVQGGSQETNHGRPRKLKVKEIKGETQIS
jgi:hypothetical protein